ncbi:hypothetical protein B0J11DRAFT_530677 [Dendryphion nanum]|uniref:EF-hand domain-containing protein n=1 Tax=Dendryphion nanum TaxID=256645 RepID=A0A9P9IKS0_9PLEO|nr:hypothetical protein B0J11DRAFT_530677 [Dendryphion nanum]
MAYNKGFNPDKLPAHAEPEEAAAMFSKPLRPNPRPDYNKPAPAAPRPHADSYGGSGGGSYGGRPPPPGAFNNDRFDGRHSPRYDPQQQQHQQPARYDPHSPRYDSYDQRRDPHHRDSHDPHRQSYGSPRPQEYHDPRRGTPVAKPPPTPAPRDANDREALWRLFGAVDKDGNGHLTEEELRKALVNGDWSPFDPHTVRMMIRMFDTDRSGSINFDEFCGLWGFLSAWRGLFDRFDADHSGSISYAEFNEALVAFGYRLSSQFVTLLYSTYDRGGKNAISFDLFVQACISLKRMTDVFKKYDEDRDGYITLSFEEFLTEIIRQR